MVFEIADALIEDQRTDGVPGALRFGHTQHDIRAGQRVAFKAVPPAPTAIGVLPVVQALQGGIDLRIQISFQRGIVAPGGLQGLRGEYIRQEARDGLLDTFVGVVFEIVQTGSHACHQRGFNLDGQIARGEGAHSLGE